VYNFSKQREEVCHSSSLNIDQELMCIKFGKIYLKQIVKIDLEFGRNSCVGEFLMRGYISYASILISGSLEFGLYNGFN
jgi:hypothetical protein